MMKTSIVGVLGSLFLFLTGYYVLIIAKQPKIHTGNRKMKRFLKEHVKASQLVYWPAPFLWNGVLQTMFALTRRTSASFKLPYERNIVVLRDGGQVGLDYLPTRGNNETKLNVLFLPGLTSSSQTSYVKTLVQAITRAGANVYVLNNRGIGGVPLTTPKSYSAATTNDLWDILEFLHGKYPNEKLLVIGTSFGGITLNRFLIKEPQMAVKCICGGLIISSPFDLEGGSLGIEGPITKYLINYPICTDLKRRMQFYDSILNDLPWYNVKKMNKCKTVRDFDRHITSQSYGFNSEKDYYAECSSIGKLHLLPLPIYALNATDDPIQYGKYLPYTEAEAENSKLTLITTSSGGHLGFLEGWCPFELRQIHFMEKFAEDFVRAVCHHGPEIAF